MTRVRIPRTATSKQCTKCLQMLPFDQFSKANKSPDRLKYECRQCRSTEFQRVRQTPEWQAKQIAKRDASKDIPLSKPCSRCKVIKPSKDFHKSSYSLNGLMPQCKECTYKQTQTPAVVQRKKEHYERIKQMPKTIPTTKKCSNCKRILSADAFYKSQGTKSGLTGECQECRKTYHRSAHAHQLKKQWRAKEDKEKVRKQSHKYNIKRKFQLTPEQFETMLSSQNGVCAICHLPAGKKTLAVDHCHKTGAIRGLLCGICNVALGRWRDDPECAERAKEYLIQASQRLPFCD